MTQKFLKVAEVAERLRITTASVTRYLRSGQMKGIKLDRVWRVAEADLKRFLKERMNS